MTAVIPATATSEILNEFKELIDVNVEYTITELKKILSDVYKSKTVGTKASKTAKTVKVVKTATDSDGFDGSEDDKPKKKGRPMKTPKLDKDGNVKEKRKPTAYNTYIKKRIPELKEQNPSTPAKQFLTTAASEWSSLTKEEKEIYKQ